MTWEPACLGMPIRRPDRWPTAQVSMVSILQGSGAGRYLLPIVVTLVVCVAV